MIRVTRVGTIYFKRIPRINHWELAKRRQKSNLG